MTTVGDVRAALDAWAPFSQAASWDPVGLQVGAPDAPVTAAAVCHEVTAEVVDRSVEAGVSIIVTYHPLLFRPIQRLVPGSGPTGLAFRLASAGVAVIAAHTNVDAAPGGTSDALADALQLVDTRRFGSVEGADSVKVVVFVPESAAAAVREAMSAAGAGIVGLYRECSFESVGVGRFTPTDGSSPAIGVVGSASVVDEVRLEMRAPRSQEAAIVEALLTSHPYEEPSFDVYDVRPAGPLIGRVGNLGAPHKLDDFATAVAEALDHPPVRVAAAEHRVVSTVAVIPGAGASFAPEARRAGADVLVTGDARHHAAVAATRSGLSIVDATHEGTERPGMRALYRAVANSVRTVDLTTLVTNPWITP